MAVSVCAVVGLAACAPSAPPMVEAEAASGILEIAEAADVPFISVAPRQGRPCGDVVGLSMSGPFTAAIVMIGFERDLVDATAEMETCVRDNGLEVEVTSGS